jgi:uncharacterized small protein (DUF1192 family)
MVKRVTAALEEDVLNQVDEEAKRRGISRQEMLSQFTEAGLSGTQSGESSRYQEMQNQIAMMQHEIQRLNQNLQEKKDDISYYRSEVSRLSQEISSLSKSMIEIKQLPAGKDESLEAISNQMQVLTQEIASLKHQPAQSSILVRYQAAIIIGMIALLIIIAAVGISYILR